MIQLNACIDYTIASTNGVIANRIGSLLATRKTEGRTLRKRVCYGLPPYHNLYLKFHIIELLGVGSLSDKSFKSPFTQ